MSITKCPDCKGPLHYFHSREGSIIVCKAKCNGYKIIATRKAKKKNFTLGDNL